MPTPTTAGPLLVPLLPLIEWLLPIGGRAFVRAVGATALTRAGRHRLLRNAIAALGNAGGAGGGHAPLSTERRARRPRSRSANRPTASSRSARPPLSLQSDAPRRALRRAPLLPRSLRQRRPWPTACGSPDDADAPPARIADLTDLACPPYDVIERAERDELLARDPYNAVRLEYSAEPDPSRHRRRDASRMDRRGRPRTARRAGRRTTTGTRRTGDPDAADGRGRRRARSARAVGRAASAGTSTRCPVRRPTASALLRSTRHAAEPDPRPSTSTAPSATTTS